MYTSNSVNQNEIVPLDAFKKPVSQVAVIEEFGLIIIHEGKSGVLRTYPLMVLQNAGVGPGKIRQAKNVLLFHTKLVDNSVHLLTVTMQRIQLLVLSLKSLKSHKREFSSDWVYRTNF